MFSFLLSLSSGLHGLEQRAHASEHAQNVFTCQQQSKSPLWMVIYYTAKHCKPVKLEKSKLPCCPKFVRLSQVELFYNFKAAGQPTFSRLTGCNVLQCTVIASTPPLSPFPYLSLFLSLCSLFCRVVHPHWRAISNKCASYKYRISYMKTVGRVC